MREIFELHEADQTQLLHESVALGRALMAAFSGDKLNVAALGNLVPQLHVHHIVRRIGDVAWPAPVWGRAPAVPYTPTQARKQIKLLREHLPKGLWANS